MLVTRQYTDAEVADRLDILMRILVENDLRDVIGPVAEAAKRLRSGMSKTLQQHKDESILARHAWPIKREVGARLQAVPREHRQSYDILWDAACRGVDDGIASAKEVGAEAMPHFPFHQDRDNERLKAWEAAK